MMRVYVCNDDRLQENRRRANKQKKLVYHIFGAASESAFTFQYVHMDAHLMGMHATVLRGCYD